MIGLNSQNPGPDVPFRKNLKHFTGKDLAAKSDGRFFESYGGLYEISQKVCERFIFHVMAYAYLFEMPQNRIIGFSVFFLFEISSRVNYLKCPIFICSKYLKCPIFPIKF